MRRFLLVFLGSLLATLSSIAWSVTGPTGWLTITDVRTYDTGLLVRVTQIVNSTCMYPDHLQLYTNNANYQASVAFFMTAWAQGKKIAAYYDGCGSNGAVNVHGWYTQP